MGQKKLIRFEEFKTFPNVLEMPENMPGKWNDFFKNNQPLTLELACGKGEYAVGLGRLFPKRNFIGVDIKGNRIWKGAQTALNEGLSNVAFLRTQIDRINHYFGPNEVEEIWITFPDPQLRFSKINKRLTHPKYLRFYQQLLKPNGILNLKTDSPDLYQFTLEVIQYHHLTLLESMDDVYTHADRAPELSIKTHYEGLDIAGSQRIHYIKFQLNENLLPDRDKEFKAYLKEKYLIQN